MKNQISWIYRQQAILLAVILQDMKTRFGGSYASYMVAIAWPLTHVAVIVVGYMAVNHYAPVGDDPFMFVGTAAIPYMICLYPARLISVAILVNKPFLSYNVVTFFHLVIARTILEFMNVAIVIFLILVICFVLGVNFMPLSLADATAAVGAALLFGVTLGLFFSIMTSLFGPFFNVFVMIFMILLYLGSFAFIPDHLISSRFRDYLDYNPIFCLIGWLRSAYYPFYQLGNAIPKTYVVCLSMTILFLSLLGERLLRGRIIGQ